MARWDRPRQSQGKGIVPCKRETVREKGGGKLTKGLAKDRQRRASQSSALLKNSEKRRERAGPSVGGKRAQLKQGTSPEPGEKCERK